MIVDYDAAQEIYRDVRYAFAKQVVSNAVSEPTESDMDTERDLEIAYQCLKRKVCMPTLLNLAYKYIELDDEDVADLRELGFEVVAKEF